MGLAVRVVSTAAAEYLSQGMVAAPVRMLGETLYGVGWIGVDLFFVLSGFLVSGLLFREHRARGRLGLGRFWARRGFKIYPGFYVLLMVTWAASAGARRAPDGATRLLHEAIYVQTYLGGLMPAGYRVLPHPTLLE